MIKNYLKFSATFYICFIPLLFLSYSALNGNFGLKLLFSLVSLLFFAAIHFSLTSFLATIYASVKESFQALFLGLNILLLFIASINIYGITSGYNAGVANWGQAVDYKLYWDILKHPLSFTDLLYQNQNVNLIIVGSVLCTLFTLASYYYQKAKFISISQYFSTRKYLGLGGILLPIILIVGIASINKEKLVHSFFKDELLTAFVNPLDPIDSLESDATEKVELDEIRKLDNFDKKNVIIISF